MGQLARPRAVHATHAVCCCPPPAAATSRALPQTQPARQMACCQCCQSAIKDALKGISLLTALGGLACVLLGTHALLPLGPAAAADINVAWFAYVLLGAGGIQLLLGLAAATGSWCGLTAPLHCVSPASGCCWRWLSGRLAGEAGTRVRRSNGSRCQAAVL